MSYPQRRRRDDAISAVSGHLDPAFARPCRSLVRRPCRPWRLVFGGLRGLSGGEELSLWMEPIPLKQEWTLAGASACQKGATGPITARASLAAPETRRSPVLSALD